MFDSQRERAQFDRLLTSRDGVAVVVMAVSLGGLAAGWAGRSLLAGDPLTDQFCCCRWLWVS
jgi:hypothetical protein